MLTAWGLFGSVLGYGMLVVFGYRRIRWVLGGRYRRRKPPSGLILSICSLSAILVFTAACHLMVFIGLLVQTHHAFTHETPVARINTIPLTSESTGRLSQVEFVPVNGDPHRYFVVHGDQWVIEGDLIKWNQWLAWLGLNTRYRLTRLRGRYLDVENERHRPHSVHALCPDQMSWMWRFLYRNASRIPLVSSVYGSAAFQDASRPRHFQVYVGASGFIIRAE